MHLQILFARQEDQRQVTVAKVLASADLYIANARALLLRNQVMKHGLVPVADEPFQGGQYSNQLLEGRQSGGWAQRARGSTSLVGEVSGAIAGMVSNMVGRSGRGEH